MADDKALSTATNDVLSQITGYKSVSIKEMSADDKKVLLDTVAKGANDSELAFFLNVALAQDLNPFTKEIWCIKMGDRLVIQTARDGFLKIAKRDPTFARIQSAEVREGDSFKMDPISGGIEHRITEKRGAILGAYAVITTKDGFKVSKYVTFSEYQDGVNPIWKDYPTAMICKCAESVLCKQFANVSGIVAEETIHKDGVTIDSSPTATQEQLSLKQDLLGQIAACKTMEDLLNLKQTMPGVLGKMFEAERNEVMEAAIAKAGELKALNPEPKAPVEETTEDKADDAEEPKKPRKHKSMFQKELTTDKPEVIEPEVLDKAA